MNRAFYGLPDLTNAEGLHTNAIYGFLSILFKMVEEEKPDYLTVAFDVHAPTFRHEMYKEYKGTRKPMPQELREQVPVMKDLLAAMGIEIISKEGYEADDLLGTVAKKSEAKGMEVTVLSGDRDLLQLATEHICIRIPKTKGGKTTIEDYYAKDVETLRTISRGFPGWEKRLPPSSCFSTVRQPTPMPMYRRSSPIRRRTLFWSTMIWQ